MLLFVRSLADTFGRVVYLDRKRELRIDAVGRLGVLFGSHGAWCWSSVLAWLNVDMNFDVVDS